MKLRHHAIAAAVAALCLPAGALAQTVLKFAHYAETTHPAHPVQRPVVMTSSNSSFHCAVQRGAGLASTMFCNLATERGSPPSRYLRNNGGNAAEL